jgi:hypothetical protein
MLFIDIHTACAAHSEFHQVDSTAPTPAPYTTYRGGGRPDCMCTRRLQFRRRGHDEKIQRGNGGQRKTYQAHVAYGSTNAAQ